MFDATTSLINQLQQQVLLLKQENELLKIQADTIEHELIESELRIDHLSQAAFEGMVFYQEQKVILVNEASLALFGFSREEFYRKDIAELFAPHYREEVANQLLDNELVSFETLCIAKNKQLIPCKIKQKAIPHKGKNAYVIAIYDLSENKEREQELFQTELMYKKLFEKTGDAIYISSIRGELLEVNQAALDLFGYSWEELSGMNALRLYATPEDREKFKQEMIDQETVSNYPVQLRKKDGVVLDCLISTTVRRNAKMEILGYQGIIRDISKQKRTANLVEAKELAEKSARLKEQFLANMSHEIRTPMNVVIGMTNLLEDLLTEKEQHRYLKGIRNASEHLMVLINDILDFSKIEAGKLKVLQEPFHLGKLLEEQEQYFNKKAKKKKISFDVVREEDLPLDLIGDPYRLRQIISNLLNNAFKFTEEGKIALNIKLFSEDKEKVQLAFSVEDTGIGIPEDKLENIFELFLQVDKSATTRYGGAGLGLAISKKLVEMQGGTIKVQSSLGMGSTFIFTLKFLRGKAKPQKDKQTPMAIKRLPENCQILIVEDNELNQVVLEDTIKKWKGNPVIEIANNGKEAIDKIKRKKFDIILMDIQMPIMNGYETTQYVRKRIQLDYLPILAMTAYATTGEAEKTIIAGMNDYISKPFDPNVLFNKVIALLRTKKDNKVQKLDYFGTVFTTNRVDENKSQNRKVANFTYLDSATQGDIELKAKMLTIMLREVPEETAKMVQLYTDSNWKRLAAVAHKFKSAVTYLGLTDIKQILIDIQSNAELEHELDLIEDMIYTVRSVCLQACSDMENELVIIRDQGYSI